MATSLVALQSGLETVDRARRLKGYTKADIDWQVNAEVSRTTLDRFWARKPIRHQNFVAICRAVGIDDWEQVADLLPSAPVRIHDLITGKLGEFAQQIFDWFGALGFEFEELPWRKGNYVLAGS